MTNNVVMVTGAASGIGYSCICNLLRDGVSVVAADCDDIPVALLGAGDCLAQTFDVSSPDARKSVVSEVCDKFGKLSALIHLAGIHHTKTWEEGDADDFARVMAVNVTGSFLIAQAAAEMIGRPAGAIVLTASSGAELGGVGGDGRGGPAYISSKAAIRSLTRSLSRSLGKYNIRINAVSPGATKTPMIGTYANAIRDGAVNSTPLGRIALPEDISDVARFLISDESRFITGQIIPVNGGSAFG
jgi:3-oxoacyl-[acyl-carrier protein] reductase